MGKKIRVKRLEGTPYAIQSEITGTGATGSVVKAYNLQNLKEELVAKIISVNEQQHSGVYKTQLQILKQLPNHPNLVHYKKIQIASQKNLYLIMQYCNGGNLDKYMYECKYSISEEKIWFFLKQFCQGYKMLYQRGLIHRDIKPENILIHNGDFKIADFGLSKLIGDPDVINNVSIKGTPIYMAPQIPQDKEGNSKIDMFSLGVVLYRMTFKGEYPFFDQGRKYRNISQYFKQLKVRKLKIPQNSGRSQDLIDLIIRMLNKDKEQRICWKEIFQHPKVVKAFRPERKNQISTMEQFKKSLIFVNKSVIIQCQDIQPNHEDKIAQVQPQPILILQQTFNKSDKSQFQKKLYRYKLIYTLIEYVSLKIKNYVKTQSNLHKHLKRLFNKLIVQGLQFSLYIINSLRNISGQWQSFTKMQIQNFENIFDNDRLIIEQEINKFLQSEQNSSVKSHLKIVVSNNEKSFQNTCSKVIKLSYQDLLYTFLTQFWDYPKQLRSQLFSIVYLLVDVYDLVVKFEHNQIQGEKNMIQLVQNQQSNAFYQYLITAEQSNQQQLKEIMQKKGLVFK